MSLPKFPVINPPLKIEDSLNMILASIAMEAHVKQKLKNILKFTK